MVDELLVIRNLKKYFPIRGGIFKRRVGWIYAVDGITFDICDGETYGLVGESGCGKTTVGRTILRLVDPTAGDVLFRGQNLCTLEKSRLREVRREIQMIFQDPYSSLNPRMTVHDIIGEAFDVYGHAKGGEKRRRILELLRSVGLESFHMYRYPHQFSGGQRQRIAIARVLAVEPRFVVADEPVSSLDISVRAAILNLMKKLQRERSLTYLFISHDLSVVKHICNRVAVMYVGRIVETATAKDLFKNPLHPYTEALLSAVPVPNPRYKKEQRRVILKGDVPNPASPPSGCRFHPRCPRKMSICESTEPHVISVESDHSVACHLFT